MPSRRASPRRPVSRAAFDERVSGAATPLRAAAEGFLTATVDHRREEHRVSEGGSERRSERGSTPWWWCATCYLMIHPPGGRPRRPLPATAADSRRRPVAAMRIAEKRSARPRRDRPTSTNQSHPANAGVGRNCMKSRTFRGRLGGLLHGQLRGERTHVRSALVIEESKRVHRSLTSGAEVDGTSSPCTPAFKTTVCA